jgi:lysophospholipase L1-like esterase
MKKLPFGFTLIALLLAACQTPPNLTAQSSPAKSPPVLQTPAAPAPQVTPSAAPAPAPKVDASAAIEKKDTTGAFRKKHESFLERGKAGPIGVLMLGDSITEGWGKAPHVYERYYGKMDPANFGIGGDQTQHVIWRIENGELDGIRPKVVVLMLGTNNSGGHTAAEIAAADKKIVEMIRAKLPETKVLLLAIFPRGARKDAKGVVTEAAIADATKRMAVITAANAELAKLDDGKNVRFLDINAVFLGQDGKIPWQIMPDQLHPTAAGYQLWAEAMQKPLAEMMK